MWPVAGRRAGFGPGSVLAGRSRLSRLTGQFSGCVGHAGKYALIFGLAIAWNAVFELFGPWFCADFLHPNFVRTYRFHFWICQSFQIKGTAF